MKTALILDLETTGTDPAKDRIVELGMVLFSLEHRSLIRCMSAVVDAGVGNAAEALNRIPARMLVDGGITEQRAFDTARKWMGDADVVLGHNIVSFDLEFLQADLRTLRPVVDTCHDLDWPRAEKPGDGLVKLALAHDLGVATAHRALADCELIARLLTRVHEMGVELGPFLARGLRPKATYQADVPFERKDEAKEAGFKWEPATRRWLRRMAIEDAALLPFPARVVQ